MKRKLIFLVVLALALLLSTQSALALGWDCGIETVGPLPQGVDKGQSPAAVLGLSDEQSAQIKKIEQDHFSSTQELRVKLQKAMFDLRQLRWEKNLDQNKLNAAINEVKSLRGQMYQQAQKKRDQIAAVLTQEQLAKMGRAGLGCGGRFSGMKGGM